MEGQPGQNQPLPTTYEEYERQGEEYIAAQRDFYTDIPDTGRIFFRDAMGTALQDKTIVDIGCGAGDDLLTYKKLGAKRVIGVEPSRVMLSAAQETIKKEPVDLELVEGELEHMPLPDESVDIITARYSFHVIANFAVAFKEVARVLKPNGQFLIAVPHPKYDAKLAEEQQLKSSGKIKSPIFGGRVVVEYFQHTMDNYLSGEVLKYFVCENLLEYSMHEDKTATDPSGLLINYRKK